jgi:hypothetical protein
VLLVKDNAGFTAEVRHPKGSEIVRTSTVFAKLQPVERLWRLTKDPDNRK